MIVHDVVQGSEAWMALRVGRPTASNFHRIYQPERKKPSRQRDLYLLELCDEWLTGRREQPFENRWTNRGRELEAQARFGYTMETGADVKCVGFVTTDDGRCGCSPDGFVGSDVLLEVKCPAPTTHQAYTDGKKSLKHTAQIQGSLWITERKLAHLWAYSDTGESILKEVPRDSEWIEAFVVELDRFCVELEEAKHACRHARVG